MAVAEDELIQMAFATRSAIVAIAIGVRAAPTSANVTHHSSYSLPWLPACFSKSCTNTDRTDDPFVRTFASEFVTIAVAAAGWVERSTAPDTRSSGPGVCGWESGSSGVWQADSPLRPAATAS